MACVNVDAIWWVFDHRTDESGVPIEAVGLDEGARLKNLSTGKAREILAKATKGAIPHAKQSRKSEIIRRSDCLFSEICCGSQDGGLRLFRSHHILSTGMWWDSYLPRSETR